MELSERDVAAAMSLIAGREISEGDNNNGITLTELQSFAKSVRKVKSEMTAALLNKMFYASTPRHMLTVDEAVSTALHHSHFGHDWHNLFVRALQDPSISRHPSKSPRKTTSLPRLPALPSAESASPITTSWSGAVDNASVSSVSPRRAASLAAARQSHIATVVRSARESHDTRNDLAAASFGSKTSDFPEWSVHHDGAFSDPFDRLRVNQNGVSLQDARSAEEDERQQNIKKILPNESGAIVIPHSPRNMGRPVVIVDATAEKERTKIAQQRHAELKRLLAMGGTSVEKYLKNQLTIPGCPTAPASDGDTAAVSSDLSYQRTMTAIVEFLSSPRK